MLSVDSTEEKYIDKWKDIAIIESERTGIPVSIILGQAILESDYGRSELALEAKNHFGIKCKKQWEGNNFYKKDDDLNEKGDLIKSCFRAYEIDLDSYIDHSHFIMESVCYRSLIDYGSKNYAKWAFGLQQCGYATDKRYAEKIIQNIESHQLWKFDF